MAEDEVDYETTPQGDDMSEKYGHLPAICHHCNKVTSWRQWERCTINWYQEAAICPKCHHANLLGLSTEGWRTKSYLLQNSERDEWIKP